MLNFLSDNLVIATLLALTLLVLLLLAVVVWAAVAGASKAGKPPETKARTISADSLKLSFRRAVELIESNLAERGERYNLSWTLVLNEGQNGHELPLVHSGLQSALSADTTLSAAAQGITWNFFDKGVAVQLQSDHLGAPDPQSNQGNRTWDDFLGLCRSYRPERPFDAIVVAVPASAFLQQDPQGQLDLAARAKAVHRRLWLAQNRLALRFPVYLVVSECERIPGFSAFAAALPEPLRRSMLGWSSPHELVAPFQSHWVDAAMNEVTRSLSDSCAELCALEQGDADSAEYFLLPTEVERLRAGLKLFADELMRPSAYHEPFLLRGIYLTGDCSDMASLIGEQRMADRLSDADAPAPVEAMPLTDAAADGAGSAALNGQAEGKAVPADLMLFSGPAHGAEPAFLRDVFERKIFAEAGLVRASSVQRMRRPAVSRLARAAAYGLPAVWLIGLGLASVQLHRFSAELVLSVQKLDRDTRAGLASRNSESTDAASARLRALDALNSIGQMDAGRLGSVFMPGSWPWVDDLHERVQQRLERGFADNSVEPLRRAAYQQLSGLTGVAVDPATGSLLAGASCSLPAGWAEQVSRPSAGLNIEDLPEFGATSQYVARLEALDRAARAMARLKSGLEPASGADLSLVVRTLLGAEITGQPDRTAALFRQVAQTAVPLDLAPMQVAAACTLRLALKATYERLYSQNSLLLSEQEIFESSTALLAELPQADAAGAVQGWQALLASLRAQEALLGAGKGAWMQRRSLQLGQAHEQLLRRAEALALLGKPVADGAQKLAEDGFNQFLINWDALRSQDDAVGTSPGLAWSEAEGRWAFSVERRALADGLQVLLTQPYMKLASRNRFAELPAGATVRWERARLDQVEALAETRKRLQTDTLGKFPVGVQAALGRLTDAALAEAARDLLAGAYSVSTAGQPAPLTEAERSRIFRIKGWLRDLDAQGVLEDFSRVLVRDALARLRAIDQAFTQADVFVPRERNFSSWRGEKAPLLDAFGAADAAGLASYVAQQQAFVESSGAEAQQQLQLLAGEQAGNPLVQRWQALSSDMARYRLKSPTSSLLALEQFVLVGAADLDGANCQDRLSTRANGRRSSDYFGERLGALQASLLARCKDLRLSEMQDAWRRFAEAFNRDLAERPPFRTGPAVAGRKSERAPVDANELANVLKLFDKTQALSGLRSAATSGAAGAAGASGVASSVPPSASMASAGGAAVRRMAEQMHKVQELLAPLFPAAEGQVAGLDLAVEFRANQESEAEGNKIIDWTLSVGPQTLRLRDAARPLRWEPGQPVVLTLRLARDVPWLPRAEPGAAVDDRSVSYRFEDPWALLSLLASHREPDAGRSDARAQLLRFEFPLVSTEPGRPEARARVYLRLSLSAAGKRAPLVWPGSFPARAPDWGSP